MSYDLHLFRGDIEQEEEGWGALDLRLARELLSSIPDVEEAEEELYWRAGPIDVTLFPYVDEEGKLRSIAASVSDPGGSVEECRSAYRRFLELYVDMGRRLGARVYDHQLGSYVSDEDIGSSVESFV